jgi:DNA-binding transcriptional LysR family regulator
MGLAQLPEPVAAAALAAEQLRTALHDFAPTAPGVFLYYPARRQMLPQLRAFIDHVKQRAARADDSAAARPLEPPT